MGKDKVRRHRALHEQIVYDASVRPSKRKEKERSRRDDDEEFVSAEQTARILSEARKQQDELEAEFGRAPKKSQKKSKGGRGAAAAAGAKAPSLSLGGDKSDEDESENEAEFLLSAKDEFYDHVPVSEAEERAFSQFLNPQPEARRTLADIISSKLEEKKTEIATMRSEVMTEASRTQPVAGVSPEMEQLFGTVGEILAKYRSGSLPKAFKMVPSMENWEELLFITNPDSWSAAAMYQATRIFSSNLSAAQAKEFYSLILYPRLRDDIAEYRRLNFHLYMAVKKATFKSAAFFKGIVLPLCESGTCSLREALIIGSVVASASIPILQSSAAMLKIAELPYSGACSIFLRILLDKKYALPYVVVDGLVQHFMRFEHDRRELPVLWHQALLTFVARYKKDISDEQKSLLYQLLQKHSHPGITPEIRRELVA
eukprot:scpid80879/ scgid20801/ Bystin